MSKGKKSGWSIAWVVWLLSFLAIELPAAFNNEEDDTLSEHVWMWIKDNWLGLISIPGLLVSLLLHFEFKFSVIPVIVFGAGLSIVIVKWWLNAEWDGQMFRWDQWAKGLLISIFIAVVGAAGPIIADKQISGPEWWMLFTIIVGATGTYMKTHPPTVEEAIKKLEDSPTFVVMDKK